MRLTSTHLKGSEGVPLIKFGIIELTFKEGVFDERYSLRRIDCKITNFD